MIPVMWWTTEFSRPGDQWDSGMLHHLFNDDLGRVPFDVQSYPAPFPGNEVLEDLPIAIYVIAARHHIDDVAAINAQIQRHASVLLILIGDEEAAFPWREIQHSNIRFWVMSPHPVIHRDMAPWAYFFGTGCRVDTRDVLDRLDGPKDIDWYFAGQKTHRRRIQAVDGLSKALQRTRGVLVPTAGFTQGQPRGEYLETLAAAKIAPCPSGPETPDSMRLYEALEAGCLPIVDTGPEGFPLGFWEQLYGDDHPLVVTNDWNSVGGIIEAEISEQRWPRNANIVGAWWEQQKRGMVARLTRDLTELGAVPTIDLAGLVTVIITASPIPSHPAGRVLGATFNSMSRSFALAGLRPPETLLAFDGVRPEQAHLRAAYDEHVRRFVDHCRRRGGVTPVVAKEHMHQAAMLRSALELVTTPLVLVMEHDTPLSDDPIDWPACIEMMATGALDVLRFHHEAQVHPEHKHLNVGGPSQMLGVPVQLTRQWSQRPHLARASYYRRILAEHFTPAGKSFVEDRMHSVCQVEPYDHNRVGIYHPEGSIRRSLHTDGRETERKYAETQVW